MQSQGSHRLARMGNRRNGHSWARKEYGGMPVWGLILALFVMLAIAAYTLTHIPASNQSAPVTSSTKSPVEALTQELQRPTAAFIGDSWTEGSQVTPDQRFTTLVAAHFGWRGVNFGEGGTGYVTSGPKEFPDRKAIPDRMASVVNEKPSVIIFAAGINDSEKGYSDQQVRDAINTSLSEARDGAPSASIYVIGPFWDNGYPIKDVLRIRDIARDAASSSQLPFIDPLEGKWITGSNDGSVAGNQSEYIGQDGAHPNAAGQAWIAEQMIAALADAGATPYVSE